MTLLDSTVDDLMQMDLDDLLHHRIDAESQLDPAVLKPGLIDAGDRLNASLVVEEYSGGPASHPTLKPGLTTPDGRLKPSLLDEYGNLKPSLRKSEL